MWAAGADWGLLDTGARGEKVHRAAQVDVTLLFEGEVLEAQIGCCGVLGVGLGPPI